MPIFSSKGELWGSILAGALLVAGYALSRGLNLEWAGWLVWGSLLIGGLYGGRAALEAILDKRVDIDVLMVIGAGLAAYIGHPEEGALLLFLFTLAGALEDLAMQRTTREVEALHALMPTDALVLRDGAWVEAEAESLTPGERIKIRQGERVPADATVAAGASAMDQSAMTGESMPRSVGVGDELYAGTINTDDPIEATVLRPVKESSLQRILDLVTTAREQREPVQRMIDRLSQPYAVGVLSISALVFLVWWLPMGRTWEDAWYVAITLLIVASPCALVIATPTATLASIARAARAGVLFKGGSAIDALSRTGAVAFDKTGTLTIGKPRLQKVIPVVGADEAALLRIAAALEEDSTHPIATAIRDGARERGLTPDPVTEVNHTVGKGIGGVWRGRRVRLGNLAHTHAMIPEADHERVRDALARIQGRGELGVVIAVEGGESPAQAGVLVMADQVRPGAPTLVRDLHAMGVRPVRMLTGDNQLTARHVATTLGLDAFDAELMPQDKVMAVAAMKTQAHAGGRGVAVIGDGVNDAPALAAADIGIAVGSIGTAAALETADVVLLSDNLGVVPWAIGLARRTRATVKVNLILALSIIVVMGILTVSMAAVGPRVPLTLGVLAHEGGTLMVVFNSLLLLGFRGPAATPEPSGNDR